MRYKDINVIEVVKNYLESHQYPYEIRTDYGYYEYILENNKNREIIVRCRQTSNQRVTVSTWMPMDKVAVKENWNRLLDACNITNQHSIMQAMLFEDGVAVSYLIPECGAIVLREMLDELLYDVYRINPEIFNRAIDTDEDLYEYQKQKWEEEQREFKEKYLDRKSVD